MQTAACSVVQSHHLRGGSKSHSPVCPAFAIHVSPISPRVTLVRLASRLVLARMVLMPLCGLLFVYFIAIKGAARGTPTGVPSLCYLPTEYYLAHLLAYLSTLNAWPPLVLRD
eukprot:6190203-Pleurochrysis_carterae.AAC.2